MSDRSGAILKRLQSELIFWGLLITMYEVEEFVR